MGRPDILQLLVDGMRPSDAPVIEACRHVCLAHLYERDRPDIAATHFSIALEEMTTYDMVVEAAHAKFGLGRCRLATGAANAANILDQAAHDLESFGALRSAANARQFATRTDAIDQQVAGRR